MKKYFSSLIVLTLFLNSFSVFAMKKIEEEDEQEYSRVLNSTTGMNVRIEGDMNGCIENLPDHLITWKILPFLDAESLRNVKNANNFFRKRAGEFLSPIDLKNLENGVLGELFGSFLEHEEIRELVIRLESKIRKDRNLFLYKDVNELKIEDLTEKNVKKELFKIFKNRDPKLVKVFDRIMKILKKAYAVQGYISIGFPLQAITFTESKLLSLLRLSPDALYEFFLIMGPAAALFVLAPPLLLGKAGLLLTALCMHNLIALILNNIPLVNNTELSFHNTLCCKLIRGYLNIFDHARKCLRSYICDEEKLRKAIYDEKKLLEKKNQ